MQESVFQTLEWFAAGDEPEVPPYQATVFDQVRMVERGWLVACDPSPPTGSDRFNITKAGRAAYRREKARRNAAAAKEALPKGRRSAANAHDEAGGGKRTHDQQEDQRP